MAVYLDLLEQLPTKSRGYDVDVLLVYESDTPKAAVAAQVAKLTQEGKTVSAQKNIPQKLRYQQLLRLSKEGKVC